MLSRVSMKNTGGGVEPELSRLLARIQHLKHEHGPLLAKIQRDRGMSVALRHELLEHLREEEAEIVTKLAVISPALAARYRPGAPGPAVSVTPRVARPASALRASPPVQQLSVGSLRPDSGTARTAGRLGPLTIGSLRPR